MAATGGTEYYQNDNTRGHLTNPSRAELSAQNVLPGELGSIFQEEECMGNHPLLDDNEEYSEDDYN